MDKNKLHYFKNRLLEEKEKMLKALDNVEGYDSMDLYYSELSNRDNHPADIGTELFMMEQDNGFKNSTKDTLHEIETSFEDMQNGVYGICKSCGNKIYEERLNLIPYLKSCIDCANDITITPSKEIEYRQFVPIYEENSTSFSDTNPDMVGFDREDSYQEVASYNYVADDPSFHTGDLSMVDDEQHSNGVEEVENISQEYYDETLK